MGFTGKFTGEIEQKTLYDKIKISRFKRGGPVIMRENISFWWYVTIVSDDGNEEILHSLADMTGSIGAEILELPACVKLRAYYGSSRNLSHWKDALTEAMKQWDTVRIEDFGKIENQPWNVASEEAFPPLEVGDGLVVLAPWHKGSEPAGRLALYINPGSAFGTGYHESTQIALELLEKNIKKGEVVADIGTGSGILTISALKMGAAKAYARDIDPAVIEEVRKSFDLNDLEPDRLDLATGDLLKNFDHNADILTANILLEPLLTMLQDVPPVLGRKGVAVFSGMLRKERDIFLKALTDIGMNAIEERAKGDWWGVSASVASGKK